MWPPTPLAQSGLQSLGFDPNLALAGMQSQLQQMNALNPMQMPDANMIQNMGLGAATTTPFDANEQLTTELGDLNLGLDLGFSLFPESSLWSNNKVCLIAN